MSAASGGDRAGQDGRSAEPSAGAAGAAGAGPSGPGGLAGTAGPPERPGPRRPLWRAHVALGIASAREAARVLAGTPRVLRLVWEVHPGYATALLAIGVAQGLVPLAEMWIFQHLVDAVAAAALAGRSPRRRVLVELAAHVRLPHLPSRRAHAARP